MILECPIDYTAKIGDLGGGGLVGGYKTSLDECRRDCDARTDCRSFQFGDKGKRNKGWCKLLKQSEPNGPVWNDFIFCTKGKC